MFCSSHQNPDNRRGGAITTDTTRIEMEQNVVQSGDNRDAIEQAGSSKGQSPPPIFKLTIDEIEEICEWLSMADWLALRQTCKRFKRTIDHVIEENYHAIKLGRGKLKLYIMDIRTIEDGKEKIINYDNKFDRINKFDSGDIKLIKEVEMWGDKLGATDLLNAQRILGQIEKLHIGTWEMEGEFYDAILRWCTKLKCLSIWRIEGHRMIGDNNYTWMQRNYPTIQQIVLNDRDIGGGGAGFEIIELATFFIMNPQVRHFSTTFHFLWENRKWILASEIRFDQLDVEGDCYEEHGMDRICGLLNSLHDRGFYQRCQFHANSIYEQEEIDHIVSVRGMEKLYMDVMVNEAVFVPMSELKELCLSYSPHFGKWDEISNNLGNVERVYFRRAVCSDIVPIIRSAAKVREIKIHQLDAGDYFENGIVDVSALNEIRKRLCGAKSLTIYVKEDIFLATKWAHGETRFDSIELKRAECVEWIMDNS